MAGDGFLKWPLRTLEMATCTKQQPAMNSLVQLIEMAGRIAFSKVAA
jgi:hypothetical protein